MRKLTIVGISLLSLLLTSCTDMAITGAQAFYGRRTIENNFTDQYITLQVYKNIQRKTDEFKDGKVVIATHHREVLLTGQVPHAWQKQKAYQLATQVPGVEKVYNLIEVSSPTSSITRMSDAWITTKIKTKYIACNDLDASQIKVVTENGTVYLMGIILPEEADIAVDLARTTEGVQRVVRMFSYLHISKKYEYADNEKV